MQWNEKFILFIFFCCRNADSLKVTIHWLNGFISFHFEALVTKFADNSYFLMQFLHHVGLFQLIASSECLNIENLCIFFRFHVFFSSLHWEMFFVMSFAFADDDVYTALKLMKNIVFRRRKSSSFQGRLTKVSCNDKCRNVICDLWLCFVVLEDL